MTEPESIMKPINDPDKVVCISLELLEAYVFLFRTAQLITWCPSKDDIDELDDAVATVIKAGGSHE
jgi:hypothetical protein